MSSWNTTFNSITTVSRYNRSRLIDIFPHIHLTTTNRCNILSRYKPHLQNVNSATDNIHPTRGGGAKNAIKHFINTPLLTHSLRFLSVNNNNNNNNNININSNSSSCSSCTSSNLYRMKDSYQISRQYSTGNRNNNIPSVKSLQQQDLFISILDKYIKSNISDIDSVLLNELMDSIEIDRLLRVNDTTESTQLLSLVNEKVELVKESIVSKQFIHLGAILDIRKYIINIQLQQQEQQQPPPQQDHDRLNQFSQILQFTLKELLTNKDSIENNLICREINPRKEDINILKQIIENEQVHPYSSEEQIFDRIRDNRLCLVLFHKNLQTVPLMSLYIALTNGIANNMMVINNEPHHHHHQFNNDPISSKPDSAMFYSISSLQKGLKGVELGQYLIEKATTYLSQTKSISNFCTLSPIPNFCNYLKKKSIQDETLKELLNSINLGSNIENHKDQLESYCLNYLINEKKKGNKTLDPVSNFHLKNGASFYRLNWNGDTSITRWNESFGLMMNYLYDLESKKSNSEAYKSNGTIKIGDAFKSHCNRLNVHPTIN